MHTYIYILPATFSELLHIYVSMCPFHAPCPCWTDLTNDIAILVMAMPIPEKYKRRVSTVSLPTKYMEERGYPATGTNCTVFGWGLSHVPQSNSERVAENVEPNAMKVDVEVRNKTLCSRWFDYFVRTLGQDNRVGTYDGRAFFCAGNFGTKEHKGAFSVRFITPN